MKGPASVAQPVPDGLWCVVETAIGARPGRKGRPRLSDRRVFSGILYVRYTATAWKRLPREFGFGAGNSCRRRYEQWRADGTWDRIDRAMTAALRAKDDSLIPLAQCIHEWVYSLRPAHEPEPAPIAASLSVEHADRRALFGRPIPDESRVALRCYAAPHADTVDDWLDTLSRLAVTMRRR